MKKVTTAEKKDKPVTKSYLDQKLANFATKDDLKQVVQDVSNQIYDKLDTIQTTQDRILKELVDIREENVASTLHFERNDKVISAHEKRITTLEASQN